VWVGVMRTGRYGPARAALFLERAVEKEKMSTTTKHTFLEPFSLLTVCLPLPRIAFALHFELMPAP
jgi:hypothetical protein